MAEGGPGKGRGGRGAMIAKLLELEKRPGQPAAQAASTPTPEAAPSPAMPLPSQRPGGRGAFLARLTQQPPPVLQQDVAPPQQQTPPRLETTPDIKPPGSSGRGKVYERMRAQAAVAQPGAAQAVATPAVATPASAQTTEPQPHTTAALQANVDVESIRRQVQHVRIDPEVPPIVWRGTQGKTVPATSNYIRLLMQPGRGIFEYDIRFNPPVDDRDMCEKMLFLQHKDLLGYRGNRRTFDGVTLYVPRKLPEEAHQLTSVHPITNESHTISLILRRERSMLECTHMYNVLFKNIQKELKLVQLKPREYFCNELAFPIPQHKLEVWPGYVTAVEAFEGGIMLNCNCTTKVLRTQTVLDLIHELTSMNVNDWKERLTKMLVGQSVMIKVPLRMYRIDDIDFEKNPTCTFSRGDGTSMTILEYHNRKGVEIKDSRQPLLVYRPKPNKRPGAGQVGLYYLVPELCYLTGLTDEMRADFKVMKDVAMYTRVSPNQRHLSLQKFINNIKESPNCVSLLDEWGLKVPDATIELTARVMEPENIFFGRNYKETGSANADWGRASTSQHMLETVNIYNWLIIHTQRDDRNSRDFVDMMGKVCPQMGVDISHPAVEKIRDDRTDTYLKTLKDSLNEELQLVVVIFPSSRDDRYSAVKKFCCTNQPIPSQVINSRTISRPDKLRSIVQKIALQINCKLGGALWSVTIPFKRSMFVGIDTYHDTKTRAQSVAGFVASINPSVTRWHSQVFIQSSNRELVDGLRVAMCTALTKYYEVNNFNPDTIIIFRDGVGDGQLNVVEEFEIQAIQKAFITISPDYQPRMIFIVCQKRISTRIFIPMRGGLENPKPGTVVDHTITRRNRFDFFLVSQLVRQGTVTPTHYVVLHNSAGLEPDKIQKLTYKMCHLYYNWPGTVRVPAPCQYAHKLAHLVGCSLHKEPAQILCDKLFFL